ncbi:uncharacterized protein LACBIDRAFT_335184 [Laccaria bicolor S238N-H82]|uniref:Predicted protein n=1 Tax=Laccaria bicolor (strain S238N-H82 / ATCC MYA-4686) TaxID=486041 RepID=B0E1M0_LACBS|nr:uncharacterized protein LACBIDRAFT_335184 [Laccaria bicolor S238N-H82]EDQ99288.1 predicted protein [Laccaria bicolor S238N-H82]|eukprot:XP_001890098.1 predicted protein [Laccaria bicolor S238N-H82]
MWPDLDGHASRCKPATPTMDLRMRRWQKPSGAGFRRGCDTPMRNSSRMASQDNNEPNAYVAKSQPPMTAGPAQRQGNELHDGGTMTRIMMRTTDQPTANTVLEWETQRAGQPWDGADFYVSLG